MAMGIPIVCNDIGDTGRIVNESGAGIVTPSFDIQNLQIISQKIIKNNGYDKERLREAAINYYNLTRGVQVYKIVYGKIKF